MQKNTPQLLEGLAVGVEQKRINLTCNIPLIYHE